MKFVKKYWLEFIVFGAVFTILMVDLNPDFCFMNKAADSIGYIYSAKNLFPAYQTSAPLYLILGHFFLMIPVATLAWRFALLSVLATMGTCVFIYLIIKQLTAKRWLPLLGVLIYGMSALVISQSTIVETYPLITMFATGAYYFVVNKKWKLTAILLGLGIATHLLGVVTFVIFIIAFRKQWRTLLIPLAFVLFYLYIPLSEIHAPVMWLPKGANGIISDLQSIMSTVVGVFGTISIWDLPKRIFDTIEIVGVSIGVITIFPIVYYFKRKKFYLHPLFWLIIIPIFLFVSSLDMNAFDYMLLAFPFLAIVACLGLDRLRNVKLARYFGYASLIVVVGLGMFNCYYFDIGVNLDPQLSASEFYYVELEKLPNNAIFMPLYGWEWESTFMYNKETNAHIQPILYTMLDVPDYRQQLQDEGIKMVVSSNPNLSVMEEETARSIITLNDNVWTTVSTDPSTFGSEVVPTNHDINYIPLLSQAIIDKNKTNPSWQWKPYNPYDVLTTSILEEKWVNIIFSNYNLLFFIDWGGGFFLVYWLMIKYLERQKKKKKANENRDI